MADVTVVIPARYGSTRFPGKPLAPILGKPLIWWVYEKAKKLHKSIDILVATDDKRIEDAVKLFGGNVMMTPETCANGTERLAFVARQIPSKIFINIQGDEPLIEAAGVEKALQLVKSGAVPMSTLCQDFKNPTEFQNPNAVKVVLDKKNQALYFSRLPLMGSYKHNGVYVYDRATLTFLADQMPCELEKFENLEQMRALYHNVPIGVINHPMESVGVDTPEDLKIVEKYLRTLS